MALRDVCGGRGGVGAWSSREGKGGQRGVTSKRKTVMLLARRGRACPVQRGVLLGRSRCGGEAAKVARCACVRARGGRRGQETGAGGRGMRVHAKCAGCKRSTRAAPCAGAWAGAAHRHGLALPLWAACWWARSPRGQSALLMRDPHFGRKAHSLGGGREPAGRAPCSRTVCARFREALEWGVGVIGWRASGAARTHLLGRVGRVCIIRVPALGNRTRAGA